MHCDGLADDEAIGNELADGLAGVGVGDFVDFIRVEPNFASAALEHTGGQPFLEFQRHHFLLLLLLLLPSECTSVVTAAISTLDYKLSLPILGLLKGSPRY